MTIFLQCITIITTAFIAGIALASSIVVYPILLQIKKESAIEIFKPFFNKTHKIMLTLSLLASLFALGVSLISGNWWWFGLSLIIHINGPYTIKFMMPLNRRLMDANIDPHDYKTAADLKQWGHLHAARTILNVLVFSALVVYSLYFNGL